jgi:hypothetical protein
MNRILAIALFALLLAQPSFALAAWVATDDFETYTNGASMNGASGGSGFTDNWSTANWIATTASSYHGTKAARTTNGFMQRDYGGISSGTVTLYVALMRSATDTTHASRVYVQNAAQSAGVGIQFNETSGAITVDGSTANQVIVPTFTAGQWYVFRIIIDRDNWKVSVDYSTDAYGSAGTWNTGVTNISMFGSASDLSNLRYECDNLSTTFYYTDYLGSTSPFTSPVSAAVLDQSYSFWW